MWFSSRKAKENKRTVKNTPLKWVVCIERETCRRDKNGFTVCLGGARKELFFDLFDFVVMFGYMLVCLLSEGIMLTVKRKVGEFGQVSQKKLQMFFSGVLRAYRRFLKGGNFESKSVSRNLQDYRKDLTNSHTVLK